MVLPCDAATKSLDQTHGAPGFPVSRTHHPDLPLRSCLNSSGLLQLEMPPHGIRQGHTETGTLELQRSEDRRHRRRFIHAGSLDCHDLAEMLHAGVRDFLGREILTAVETHGLHNNRTDLSGHP